MNSNPINTNESHDDIPVVHESVFVPQNKAKLYFTRVGLALMLITLVSFGIGLGLAYLCAYVFPKFYMTWQYLWFASIIPLYCFAAPAYYFMLPNKKIVPPCAPDPNPSKFGVGSLILSVIVVFSATIIFNYISFFIVEALKSASGGYLFGADTLSTIISASPLPVTFVCACIIAPIGEELLFRKLLLDRLLPFGGLAACLFSGLAFGLFHGNLRQFIYAFPIGVIFSYIYMKSKNIVYPIIVHSAVNLMGSVITPNILTEKNLHLVESIAANPAEISEEAALALLLCFGTLFVGGLILAAGIIIVIVLCATKKISFTPAFVRIENGSLARAMYANSGSVVAFVAILFNFILDMFPAILG